MPLVEPARGRPSANQLVSVGLIAGQRSLKVRDAEVCNPHAPVGACASPYALPTTIPIAMRGNLHPRPQA